MENPLKSSPPITLRLLRELKRRGRQLKAADSTGVKLSGTDLLIRTLALRRYLLREVLEPDEKNVGVFLPPTVPAVATNFALALADRVSVNLNYTLTNSGLKQCAEKAGLKHVITSRKFLDKVGLDPGAPVVLLEDVKTKITIGDKLAAALSVKLRSADGLHRSLSLSHQRHDDTLTIVFTSGSTGVPKGVMLTGGNVTSNVDAIDELFQLGDQDVVLGVLPFFHSFGCTVTLWAAQCLKCATVFHFSPLEARPIGKLAEEFGATVLLATPTFLRAYLRRVPPEQFSQLDIVVVGAEKMPISLADEFEQRFGVRPVEGYGITELSPLVSVNTPPSRARTGVGGLREGSVGKAVTHVETRVVSIDDEEQVLSPGQAGLLEVRGPNVMKGYLNEAELTASVMHQDWYRTGDMAILDQDGFIEITGRLSRFSKIGGEMVPHIQIEEKLTDLVGTDEDGTLRVAVSAVPDARRGERIVVLLAGCDVNAAELIKGLSAAGLPNLYLPSEDDFVQVPAIPVLGSGKLDLKAMQALAAEQRG